MVMFPLVCSDDSFGVSGSSLNMLTDIAPRISAFVIASVNSFVSETMLIIRKPYLK